ncbi:Enzymatic polyprotein [Sesamum angolense]|uniref:Enzymatic polyprotein n=1 Tax=Sesamum angolense TaxID=2727404 RepID=A0AAE2BM24_9LAMI|nr:Enzymatic polyprotein [Sesamum angolense]
MDDILDAATMVNWYQYTNLRIFLRTKASMKRRYRLIRMDLQLSQNNYSEEDRLQTSESLSGFFSRMTVSKKTMERIMGQDSNISPYDGFRIGGIGKVLNQIGLNQRKHHIIYKVNSGEFAIPMEFTGNVMEMQLIPKEEILEELSRLREEIAVTMKWIHIGTIEVVIKATFKEGIDSEIHLSIMDRRINNLRDGCLGTTIGNLKEYIEILRIFKEFAKVMAPDPIRIPRIGGVDIIIKDHPVLDRTMSSRTEFSSRISFSENRIKGYKGKEKDLAKVLTPQEIRQPVIGRYEGMLEIASHEFLVAGVAGRENGCMTLGLSFLEDHKPWGRKAYIDSGSGICTAKPGVFPKEARETLPVIAGRDFSQKILILNTGIREAKIIIGGAFGTPWFRDKRKFDKVLLPFRQQGLIDSDSFYEESEEEIKNLKEATQELKTMDISEETWWDRNKIEATLKIKEECKYEYVRYKPIQMNMEDKKDMQIIIKEHINLGLIEPGISAYSSPGFLVRNHGDIKRGNPDISEKMDNLFKDYFEFMFVYIDDILIASRNMKEHIKHLEIFSDACYREGLVLSEKKATIAVNKIEFLGILIDEAGIELQEHIVEKIRNFPDILKDKKQLQSFLGVVNFAGIFIKDLAKYRKDFRPLLKQTESAKWKWEEIHTQRVRELKQVCNNLPKLAIPQDKDELVVYTDANDYRWAAVLMKKTTTGEEPCRYTGGLFTEQQARVWHINEKEFFAVAGQVQIADLDIVQTNIRSSLVASTALWNALQEPIRKASPSVMTCELREQGSKPTLRVQDSKPVAADSSTACTRPSPDSGEKATIESQGVQTSDDSSQPSASGVKEEEISLRPMTENSKANTNELISLSSAWQDYQQKWEKLVSRKGVNPSKTIIETSGKYNRVWMLE